MSAFQTALSKTNKRLIQKATPEEQSRILSFIVKSCRFCQGLHDVKDCEALQNITCKFCGKKGHSANVRFCEALAQKVKRDEEYRRRMEEREQRIEETVCFYCKQAGHVKGKCPILAERNEKRETDFPVFLKSKREKKEKEETETETETKEVKKTGWSTIVQTNRPSSMVIAVEKANEESVREAERLKNEEKTKKHAEYLARCEAREQRAREYRTRYVSDMLARFGSRWFNFVKVYKDREFDNEIAQEYRRNYEREQEEREYKQEMEEYKREQIEKKAEKEREEKKRAEREHNKKTMTRQEFERWEQEEEEKEDNEIDSDFDYWESVNMSRTGYYEREAPDEYAQYCFKTGIMLDYRAKEIENNRLMNEWKKEKGEKK